MKFVFGSGDQIRHLSGQDSRCRSPTDRFHHGFEVIVVCCVTEVGCEVILTLVGSIHREASNIVGSEIGIAHFSGGRSIQINGVNKFSLQIQAFANVPAGKGPHGNGCRRFYAVNRVAASAVRDDDVKNAVTIHIVEGKARSIRCAQIHSSKRT